MRYASILRLMAYTLARKLWSSAWLVVAHRMLGQLVAVEAQAAEEAVRVAYHFCNRLILS